MGPALGVADGSPVGSEEGVIVGWSDSMVGLALGAPVGGLEGLTEG